MGDVLYDATAWRRWLLQLLNRLGRRASYQDFCRIWDRDFAGEVHRGCRAFEEAFQAFLRSMGLSSAEIDEVQAACQARRRQWEETARAFPGVKPTLARLHAAGYVLGVLSDSDRPGKDLERQVERFGLGGMFAAVVSSIDVGEIKPEPVCYRTALEQMGLTARETAFVGHDTLELAGARHVGMETIGFNFDAEAEADVFVARFEELLEVVRGGRSPYAAAG